MAQPNAPDSSGSVPLHGGNLRLALRAAGMSQNTLAEKVGVSAGFLSKAMNGERRVSPEVYGRILDAFREQHRGDFLGTDDG